jgi:hypothetical protein
MAYGTPLSIARHTFIDRARLGGYLDEEIGAVVGHESRP